MIRLLVVLIAGPGALAIGCAVAYAILTAPATHPKIKVSRLLATLITLVTIPAFPLLTVTAFFITATALPLLLQLLFIAAITYTIITIVTAIICTRMADLLTTDYARPLRSRRYASHPTDTRLPTLIAAYRHRAVAALAWPFWLPVVTFYALRDTIQRPLQPPPPPP